MRRYLLNISNSGLFFGLGERSSVNAQKTNTKRRVIYYAPPPNVVERYARQVCRNWAKNRAKVYGEIEFVSGFVRFMKLAVKIKTKQLNRENERK
jgi:hypothetical protein